MRKNFLIAGSALTKIWPISVSSPRPATPERGEGEGEGLVKAFPALLTCFRQGKLDKFFLGASGSQPTAELDFMTAAKILKPADPKENRQSIPREFYDLLDKNKGAFVTATTADAIKRLVAEDEARKSIPRREIGFHVKEDAVPYRVRRRRLR